MHNRLPANRLALRAAGLLRVAATGVLLTGVLLTAVLLTAVIATGLLPLNYACAQVERDITAEFNLKYFGLKQGRLAFTHIDGKKKDIYVLDFATLTVKPLVTSDADEEYPRWSPDGQTLSFHSNASGDIEVYTVDHNGRNLTNLSKSPGADEEADWSPDGVHLVFVSERLGGRSLFVMKKDGSSQVSLGKPRKRSNISHVTPHWSPRGNEIIHLSNEFWPGWDVVLFDMESRESKLLTTGYNSFTRPAWHPLGGSFVLSYGTGDEVDLFVFEKGAEKLVELVNRVGKDYDGEWTHDGEHLFFVGELNPGKGDYQIFVWEKAEKKVHQVTDGTGAIRHLSWTPLPTVSAIEKSLRQEQEALKQAAETSN